MKTWHEEGGGDEVSEENQEEMLMDAEWEEIEVPDVWWAEEIQKIADPEVREKEIAAAEKITGRKLKITVGPRRDGDPAVLTASAEKFKNISGWKARFGLDDMIQHAWSWYV